MSDRNKCHYRCVRQVNVATNCFIPSQIKTPHCGLVPSYGVIALGQHWFRQWLFTLWQLTLWQLNQRSHIIKGVCGIHMIATLQAVLTNLICDMCIDIKLDELQPHILVANGLTNCEKFRFPNHAKFLLQHFKSEQCPSRHILTSVSHLPVAWSDIRRFYVMYVIHWYILRALL